jgi:hypothetical protein
MIDKRQDLEKLTLGDIADNLVSRPESLVHLTAAAELARRHAKAQIDAAKYMLWSVIAIAVTSGVTALFGFLAWYFPRGN